MRERERGEKQTGTRVETNGESPARSTTRFFDVWPGASGICTWPCRESRTLLGWFQRESKMKPLPFRRPLFLRHTETQLRGSIYSMTPHKISKSLEGKATYGNTEMFSRHGAWHGQVRPPWALAQAEPWMAHVITGAWPAIVTWVFSFLFFVRGGGGVGELGGGELGGGGGVGGGGNNVRGSTYSHWFSQSISFGRLNLVFMSLQQDTLQDGLGAFGIRRKLNHLQDFPMLEKHERGAQ